MGVCPGGAAVLCGGLPTRPARRGRVSCGRVREVRHVHLKSCICIQTGPPAVCEIGHELLPWPHCRPIRSSSGLPSWPRPHQPEGPHLAQSSRAESSGQGPRRTGIFSS